jgi:peptide/nickel transport system substrate-binding protein
MIGTHTSGGRRGLLVFALALLVLVAVAAAGCGSSSSGGSTSSASPSGDQPVFKLGTVGGGYDSLNPFVGVYAQDYAAWMLMYPNLVQYSNDLKAQPDFADSWTTSANGLTWTFKTHAGATWSDGQPLTAKDAAFTINTVVRLQGGSAAALSPFVPGIKSATATDDTTLVVKLSAPSAALIANLFQLPILPEHFWAPYAKGDGAKLKTVTMDPAKETLVVAGPFTIEKLDIKGTTIFKRVDTFYGPKPMITGYGYQLFTNADAAIQALKAGQIDCVDQLPPTSADPIKSDANLQIQGFGGSIPQTLIVNDSTNNTKHPELRNLQVREALNLGVDRTAMIDSVYNGFAVPGGSLLLNLYVPQFMSASVPIPARDVAKANQLLDGLGFAKGSDGIRVANGVKMEYTLLVGTMTRAVDSRLAEILKQNFAELGIGLQQKVVDNQVPLIFTTPKPYTDFDMTLILWGLTPDPDWSLLISTSTMLGAFNLTGYSSPEYDKLWTQQTSQMDPANRKATIDQMSALLVKDQVFVPICYTQIVTAWNKQWQGVPDAGAPFGFYTYLNKTQFNALAVQK